MHLVASIARHQASAIVATIVDFTVMIVAVSLFSARPAIGTAFGAASGGVTNFSLGRRWVFRATRDNPAPQAGRYAAVSLGSLLLNSAGVEVLTSRERFNVPYVAARALVAVLVSLFWNFPLQRVFVFGERPG